MSENPQWCFNENFTKFLDDIYKALLISVFPVPKLLDTNIFFHQSASIPDRLNPPLVLFSAWLIIFSSIDWKLTGRIFSIEPYDMMTYEAFWPFGCLTRLERFFLLNSSVPFSLLLFDVKSAFPFVMCFLSFFTQKMKFSVKDFLSKCDQIWNLFRIWSHLLKQIINWKFHIFCSISPRWCCN